MASWVNRVIGAARLDAATYEEVEADKSANWQAFGVVILVAFAAGVGGLALGGQGFIGRTIAAALGWLLWAFLIWLIGTKFLPEQETRSDVGELLRTTGFAASPGLLLVFGLLPILGVSVTVAVSIWQLVAMVIAVRQALDYKSTARAIGVCAIGWAINLAAALWAAVLIGALITGGGALMSGG